MVEYEEFLSNKAFASEFAAAYSGRHDAADALWWLAHPVVDSPSGAAAPARDRAQLESLAFSRGGGVEAQRALQSLEAEISRDREDTLDALARVRPAGSQLGQEKRIDRVDRPAIPAPPVEDEFGHPGRCSRSYWWVGSATAIALIAGIGIGGNFPSGTTSDLLPPSSTETVSRSKAPLKMLDVFSQAQVATDTPPGIGFDPQLDADSFRRIDKFPATASATGVSVYAARNTVRSVCLVVVFKAPAGSTITCVPEDDLGSSGISSYRQDDTRFDDVRWNSDGSLEMGRGLTSTLTP